MLDDNFVMKTCRKLLIGYPYGCRARPVIYLDGGHQDFYVEIHAPNDWCYTGFSRPVTTVFISDPKIAAAVRHQYGIVRSW